MDVIICAMTPQQALTHGLAVLSIEATDEQEQNLRQLVELVIRWNKAFNLTATLDPDELVTRHVLDSLSVMPWITGPRVADVGSGGGFPGLPLAIVLPAVEFTLIDSIAKKTRFLEQAAIELGLKNVTVVRSRVEGYRPPEPFANVISRAYASLADFATTAGHLAAPSGALLAMKGRRPDAEIDALPDGWTVTGIERLAVPGLDEERHLVIMSSDKK